MEWEHLNPSHQRDTGPGRYKQWNGILDWTTGMSFYLVHLTTSYCTCLLLVVVFADHVHSALNMD